MIRIKEGFLLRNVAGQDVVMPVGEAAERFSGMIRLNALGAFLWKRLEQGTTEEALLADVLAEYEVEEARAKADIAAFLEGIRKEDLLCEDPS